MKRLFACLILIGFLLSACTFSVEIETPLASPSVTLTSTETVTPPIATISATAALPSAIPPQDQSTPYFFNARLGDSPNDDTSQLLYSGGTKQVYAIWDYGNMRDGLIIRREWYLDGKLWLQREVPWDFSKYGANGTVRDVSIYDMDYGLPAGSYQLRLFIDNVQQPIGPISKSPVETWVNFSILSDEPYAGFLSPNSQWSAELISEKRLIVRDSNGTPHELFMGREIPYVVWLPDNRHILFVDRDRTGQQAGTSLGIHDDLWIVEIVSRERLLLYRSDSVLGGRAGPFPSPDGHYVAAIEGSGYGDACFVDSRLIFFEFDSNFQSVKTIKQEQFADMPSAPDSVVYPIEEGSWQSNSQYLVTLNGTCNIDLSKMGDYLLDVASLKAVKK